MDQTRTVTPGELVERAAKALKEVEGIKAPEWASYVKTGAHKQRPPLKKDWWFNRSAALLCSIQRLGPIGVSKLRIKYGGKRNRGMKTEHHTRGSGAIIRTSLQQLEKAGLIAQNKEGRKGRVLTGKGASFLASLVKDESGRTKAKKAGGDASPAASPGTATTA